MEQRRPTRVLFSCSSVGITHRGIESFFRESFDHLKGTPGLNAKLLKGGGAPAVDETVVKCLPKTGRLARMIGIATGRSSYAVEQWSSFPSVAREIRRFRPHVVFTSDANLSFLLRRFRRQIGAPFRVLFSNGGPCHPPFDRHDFVHQVAPFYLDEAVSAGEPPEKHFLVPYGIHVPEAPIPGPEEKRALRERLRLPVDRRVILSVGWIARRHKRMDYVIEEIARLPEPRPFLQLLGAIDEDSAEIVAMGDGMLGPENFSVRSVPYEEVHDYYRGADLFVLASLQEGFGRVYLEALMHGLPTIGHDHPVIRYVLGDAGICADLSRPGGLAEPLSCLLKSGDLDAQSADASRRRASVANRFGWEALRGAYLEMFRQAAGGIQ